jgi:hypothetical protein
VSPLASSQQRISRSLINLNLGLAPGCVKSAPPVAGPASSKERGGEDREWEPLSKAMALVRTKAQVRLKAL